MISGFLTLTIEKLILPFSETHSSHELKVHIHMPFAELF